MDVVIFTRSDLFHICKSFKYVFAQASQRGDPLSTLKKQLEEKEKLLTAQQEDAAAAKSRLRELSKVNLAAFRPNHLISVKFITSDLLVWSK